MSHIVSDTKCLHLYLSWFKFSLVLAQIQSHGHHSETNTKSPRGSLAFIYSESLPIFILIPISVTFIFLPLLSFWIQFSSDNIWSDTTWECHRAAGLLNKPISHPFLFCSHCYEKLIQIPSASFLFGYQGLFVFPDFLKCTHTYPLQILVILFSDLPTTGGPAVLSVAHSSPSPLPWKNPA